MKLKILFSVFILIAAVVVPGVAVQTPLLEQATPKSQAPRIAGRWRVKFSLSGVGEKNLVFDPQAGGSGSFLLLDTGADDKPVTAPALWSETTNNRVGFSAEVELQLNCCREKGTLIFKGKFNPNDSISGKAIFVGSTIDEENFNGVVSTVGTFTASRVPQ